jgi:hypothetical protein
MIASSCWRVLALVLAVAGCGGPAPGPQTTLERYRSALASQDFVGAYALMSSVYRAGVTQDQFIRHLRSNPVDVSETAKRLAATGDSVELSAEFSFGIAEVMRLVFEEGKWRVATSPLGFYDQSSPRAALRSFVRAYRLGRWEMILRFVPDAYRARMDVAKVKAQFQGPRRDELATMVNQIEAQLDQPIEERGSEARLRYTEQRELKLVREPGGWKIQDLD